MQVKSAAAQPTLEIPGDIICPITAYIMTDPVILVESGNTYEREAIVQWLKTKKTDPLTNEVIRDETIAPNRMAKRLIQGFLDKQRALHPHIDDETHLPKLLIQTLVRAMEKNDVVLFKETLKKDSRLLVNALKQDKTIFTLVCESGSLEILEVVVGQLGDKLKQLKGIEEDQGLSVFLKVSGRLGLKGAMCISKAMDWKSSHFQGVLVSSLEQNSALMAEIALSLGAVATNDLIDQATAEKKTDIVRALVLLGISVDQVDAQGNTPLHYFAMQGKDEIVKLFMKKNASIKDKNQEGKTPVQLARENGHNDLANWMEEKHRYKKVKPFLKPLEAKFESKIQEQTVAIQSQKSEMEQHQKNAQQQIGLLRQENQQLREELKALKVNAMTQKTNWEKFSMFSERDAKSLMTVAEKQQKYDQSVERKWQKKLEDIEKGKKNPLQDALIEALLAGNLESVKLLKMHGASLLYPNGEGLYPLVAAVYGCNLEAVRYVELALKERALSQWSEVDVQKAIKRVNQNMPTKLSSTATYADVGNWYVKHSQAGWRAYYDAACLSKLEYSQWGGWDGTYDAVEWDLDERWGEGSARVSWNRRVEIATDQRIDEMRTINIKKCKEKYLADAGTNIHEDVCKEIREQLEKLRADVETKALRPSVVGFKF